MSICFVVVRSLLPSFFPSFSSMLSSSFAVFSSLSSSYSFPFPHSPFLLSSSLLPLPLLPASISPSSFNVSLALLPSSRLWPPRNVCLLLLLAFCFSASSCPWFSFVLLLFLLLPFPSFLQSSSLPFPSSLFRFSFSSLLSSSSLLLFHDGPHRHFLRRLLFPSTSVPFSERERSRRFAETHSLTRGGLTEIDDLEILV